MRWSDRAGGAVPWGPTRPPRQHVQSNAGRCGGSRGLPNRLELLGLSRIGPELANSGRQPANRHSVPASPDPPCGDLITAQSRAPPSLLRSRRSCSLLLAAVVRESPDPTIVRVDAPTDLDAPGTDGLTRRESTEHVWRRKGYRDRIGVREMSKNQGHFRSIRPRSDSRWRFRRRHEWATNCDEPTSGAR